MGWVEWDCPKCGKRNKEQCNAWVYGSPIRNCKACNEEYFDNRWVEVAAKGIEPGSNDPKLYLGGAVIFLIVTCICLLWIKTNESYPGMLLGFVAIGGIASIGCIIMFLRIITGYEDKQNKQYYEESRKRLQNKAYVDKLLSYGYDLPENGASASSSHK